MNATGTEARVIHDICERQKRGIAKYGTTVSANPLDLKQWVNHAYEECLDQAVYLKRIIEELEKRYEKTGAIDASAYNSIEGGTKANYNPLDG